MASLKLKAWWWWRGVSDDIGVVDDDVDGEGVVDDDGVREDGGVVDGVEKESWNGSEREGEAE